MARKQKAPRGDTKRVTFYLPSALHRRLRVLAATTDTKATELARRYITEGLDADERAQAGSLARGPGAEA